MQKKKNPTGSQLAYVLECLFVCVCVGTVRVLAQ